MSVHNGAEVYGRERKREEIKTSSGKEVRMERNRNKKAFELIEKNSETFLLILSYEWRKDQLGATALRIAFLVRVL